MYTHTYKCTNIARGYKYCGIFTVYKIKKKKEVKHTCIDEFIHNEHLRLDIQETDVLVASASTHVNSKKGNIQREMPERDFPYTLLTNWVVYPKIVFSNEGEGHVWARVYLMPKESAR